MVSARRWLVLVCVLFCGCAEKRRVLITQLFRWDLGFLIPPVTESTAIYRFLQGQIGTWELWGIL